MPSNHVYSVFELSAVPQFSNQSPPGAQQLTLPDFLMVPHLEHMDPIVVTVVGVAADVGMWILGQRNEETTDKLVSFDKHSDLLLQACKPSIHVYSTFALPPFPHILNQAPPGAQQLTLPDFLKVPHLGHVIGDVITDAATVDVASGVPVDISVGVLTGLAVGVMVEAVLSEVVDVVYTACIILFTSMMGADDIVHSVRDIDPDEPTNISVFRAVE